MMRHTFRRGVIPTTRLACAPVGTMKDIIPMTVRACFQADAVARGFRLNA
jgi:hypothetical protein